MIYHSDYSLSFFEHAFLSPAVKDDGWLRLFGVGMNYLEDLACAASNGAQIFAHQQLSNFIGGSKKGAGMDGSLIKRKANDSCMQTRHNCIFTCHT